MLLALKAGTALALAASGPIMSGTGFVPNVPQTESSLLGIRILFAGMPCAGFLLGALWFRRFALETPEPIALAPRAGRAGPRWNPRRSG
jgi:Na+/melibiose symporter-like transporter